MHITNGKYKKRNKQHYSEYNFPHYPLRETTRAAIFSASYQQTYLVDIALVKK